MVLLSNIEGFSAKMNNQEKERAVDTILQNGSMFYLPYDEVKNNFSWIDPVMYEKIRNLLFSHNFNKASLEKIF